MIEAARVIIVATPIYNYDANAAAKNLVELTGSAWEDKTVGFLCAAGGALELHVDHGPGQQPDARFPLPDHPALRLRQGRRFQREEAPDRTRTHRQLAEASMKIRNA